MIELCNQLYHYEVIKRSIIGCISVGDKPSEYKCTYNESTVITFITPAWFNKALYEHLLFYVCYKTFLFTETQVMWFACSLFFFHGTV